MMQRKPYFSIVVSSFNREKVISRCIDSCVNQTFQDFDLVVVDDGSTDNTIDVIKSYQDKRIRLIQHDGNKGMAFARATGYENASGDWVVQLDSDQSLDLHALEILYHYCVTASQDIGVIGGKFLWDTGEITPKNIPFSRMGYIERILWSEMNYDQDYLHCKRLAVHKNIPYPKRRGSASALMELEVAKHWITMMVDDILAYEFTDAPNSFHREKRDLKYINRKRNAKDQAQTYLEIITNHEDALLKYAPNKLAMYWLKLGFNYFLAGNKKGGIIYTMKYLKAKPRSLTGWATLLSGVLGEPVMKFAYIARDLTI